MVDTLSGFFSNETAIFLIALLSILCLFLTGLIIKMIFGIIKAKEKQSKFFTNLIKFTLGNNKDDDS